MSLAVDLVRRFQRLRALVIGDAMLDTYLEGSATRLCTEGPVPVVQKKAEHCVPGGAANTAANLHALDADVTFLSIVGQDAAGSALLSALRAQGVSDRCIVEDAFTNTLHKLRILANGQYIVRCDAEVRPLSLESQQQLLAHLEEVFPQSDLVVISDYGYGVVSGKLIERLRKLHSLYPCVLLIDSKNLTRFRHVRATVVTPNHLEARLLFEPDRGLSARETTINISHVEYVGKRLMTTMNAEHAAITMAGEGVLLVDRQQRTVHIPTHPVAQAHDVGAGDSFAAAMALALAAGGSVEEAARIAIDAATIAVSKRWTAVVRHQELLQRASLRDHIQHTHSLTALSEASSAQALSQLVAQLETERQQGRTIVFTNGVFDILHAGHIYFLRQANALGDVLVVAINSDSSTQRIKGKNRPINSEQDRVAVVAALDAVDYVVLFDEDTPTALIRVLRPHIHVKGGDYANEVLPEAEAVREVGGQVVILPLAGSMSTSSVIDRIVTLARNDEMGVEA
ncbi:MAG: D-glycero-beta-D-manno-heptose 1-phosphate adenylyltransferase [Ktedonobacteraceae bacterium]|nr:D-glycero-beta-D-manno-heptose 1-phosphate adenylyltransferase [Ktedonobacteraceae bacterium]